MTMDHIHELPIELQNYTSPAKYEMEVDVNHAVSHSYERLSNKFLQ